MSMTKAELLDVTKSIIDAETKNRRRGFLFYIQQCHPISLRRERQLQLLQMPPAIDSKEGIRPSIGLVNMSFKRSHQNVEGSGSNTERMWDKMAWRSVDVAKENLGDYEDTVFFGLEELDGNAYKLRKTEKSYFVESTGVQSVEVNESDEDFSELVTDPGYAGEGVTDSTAAKAAPEKKSKRKTMKELRKAAALAASNEIKSNPSTLMIKQREDLRDVEILGEEEWGGIKLHVLLQKALLSLNFNLPTPIQKAAIPVVATGKYDLVGAAETGSGKTLAFGLPVLDFLLRNWKEYSHRLSPVALIIAPTRELAMQISTVLKEVSAPFKEQRKVEIVVVVGGFSEHKQRRLLCGGNGAAHSRPVHILVATPGRLCELMTDDEIPMFRDMSGLKFLIVDEADRIVEEGHFPELHKMFSRIRNHEKLVEIGESPALVAKKAKEGTHEKDSDPSRIVGKKDHFTVVKKTDPKNNQGITELVKKNPEEMETEESVKSGNKKKKHGSENYDYNVSDIVDLHSYVDPKKKGRSGGKGKGKGKGEKAQEDNEEEEEKKVEHYEGEEYDDLLAELRDSLPVFDTMPTEEEMAIERERTPAIPYEQADEVEEKEEEEEVETEKEIEDSEEGLPSVTVTLPRIPCNRQTLLFSATALRAEIATKKSNKDKKWLDKVKIKGIGGGAVKSLPLHLQQLLSVVSVMGNTHVADVTGSQPTSTSSLKITNAGGADKSQREVGSKNKGNENAKGEEGGDMKKQKLNKSETNAGEEKKKKSGENKKNAKDEATENKAEEEEEEVWDGTGEEVNTVLPKGLKQLESRVPAEEKDALAYYYLLKHPGRSLLFVNSIKSARRVDGLLRALGLNCRTIHAQLQQRQRMRALEAFRSAPIGVLVATDVAARGLDIPKIQSVVHYDVARSPQLYIHRSGRTARANATGTTVSLVAPEDAHHHNSICSSLSSAGVKEVIIPQGIDKSPKLPSLAVDLSIMPAIRDRIKLAKKIFTQSFVVSKRTKEQSWLRQSADDADLELDEYTVEESGSKEQQQAVDHTAKKAVDRARFELKMLLEQPLSGPKSAPNRKKGFVVFAR